MNLYVYILGVYFIIIMFFIFIFVICFVVVMNFYIWGYVYFVLNWMCSVLLVVLCVFCIIVNYFKERRFYWKLKYWYCVFEVLIVGNYFLINGCVVYDIGEMIIIVIYDDVFYDGVIFGDRLFKDDNL